MFTDKLFGSFFQYKVYFVGKKSNKMKVQNSPNVRILSLAFTRSSRLLGIQSALPRFYTEAMLARVQVIKVMLHQENQMLFRGLIVRLRVLLALWRLAILRSGTHLGRRLRLSISPRALSLPRSGCPAPRAPTHLVLALDFAPGGVILTLGDACVVWSGNGG